MGGGWCSLFPCHESRHGECRPGEKGFYQELYYCYCKKGTCANNHSCPSPTPSPPSYHGPIITQGCLTYATQNDCVGHGCRWHKGSCQAQMCQPDDPNRRREGSPCAFWDTHNDCQLALISRRRTHGAEAAETCQTTCQKDLGCALPDTSELTAEAEAEVEEVEAEVEQRWNEYSRGVCGLALFGVSISALFALLAYRSRDSSG